MKTIFVLLIILQIFSLSSCSQSKLSDKYNESYYSEFTRGIDPDYPNYPYVIIFKNKNDTNYTLKKVFFDSSYKQILHKSFFYKGIPEGPFLTYVNGIVSRQGTYSGGKWDGERITYQDGKIVQKAFFKRGIKIGIWEEYNDKGQLVRKTTYDEKGNIVEDIKF